MDSFEKRDILIVMKRFLFLLVVFVVFWSCEMPPQDPEDFVDQNLQGRIDDKSFAFVSGYANSYSNGMISVYLYNVNPANNLDPWHMDAYIDVYPYVSLNFDSTNLKAMYQIGLFSDILVTSVLSISADFNINMVAFDGGQVEITSVDTVKGEVSGRIWAKTAEKTSYLNGNFTVPIAP